MSVPQIVVLDTDVWSILYANRRGDERADPWRELLKGLTVVIASQSRAEVLAGMLSAGFGDKRRSILLAQLDATPTVPVDESVVWKYAELTANCKAAGHALHDKLHTGDRWVAATAIAIDAPLLAGDGIYRAAPLLHLLNGSSN